MFRISDSSAPAKSSHKIKNYRTQQDQAECATTKDGTAEVKASTAKKKQKHNKDKDDVHGLQLDTLLEPKPWGVTRGCGINSGGMIFPEVNETRLPAGSATHPEQAVGRFRGRQFPERAYLSTSGRDSISSRIHFEILSNGSRRS